jgi:hypothetical protein
MAAYQRITAIGPSAIAGDIVVLLRKRGMAAGLICAQIPVLEQCDADAAATAGKTVDLLLGETIVDIAGHAAVRADAIFCAAAENSVNHTVVTHKFNNIII